MESDLVLNWAHRFQIFFKYVKMETAGFEKRKTKLKTTPEEPSIIFLSIKTGTGGSLEKKEAHNTSTYYIHLWQQLPAFCSHL